MPHAPKRIEPRAVIDDGQRLRAAVLAEVRANEPRLAYAAWLRAKGDSRGEFIETQIALARGDLAEPEQGALAAREAELLAANGEAWRLGLEAGEATFQRGFIEEIYCSIRTLIDVGKELFAREPVRSVKMSGDCNTKKMMLFARASYLAPITRLDMSHLKLGDKGSVELARFAELRNLTELRLDYCDVGEEGAAAIVGSAVVAKLALLHLNSSGVCTAGAVALAASKLLGNVTRLELSNNSLMPEGAVALAGSAGLPNLRHLRIDSNLIGDKGVEAIAQAGWASGLTSLNLWNNRFGHDGAKALAQSKGLQGLTELDVSGNEISEKDCAAISERWPFAKVFPQRG